MVILDELLHILLLLLLLCELLLLIGFAVSTVNISCLDAGSAVYHGVDVAAAAIGGGGGGPVKWSTNGALPTHEY